MRSKTPEIQIVQVEKLVPYWRNPRNIEPAVEKVMESIKAYGYQVPIIVDKKMTIISGHARYNALKRLGVTEAAVIVSDMTVKQAKEFRIVDNRTAEYATWTEDLKLELKEFTKPEMLDIFFPTIKLETNFIDAEPSVTQGRIDQVQQDLERAYSPEVRNGNAEPMIELPCPNCLEIIKVAVKDILKDRHWTE